MLRSVCQRVEEVRCRRGFVFDVAKLALANYMHRFDARNDDSGAAKGFETEHGSRNAVDGAMVLLNDII